MNAGRTNAPGGPHADRAYARERNGAAPVQPYPRVLADQK
jgi:hypothetical protein